MSVSRLAHITKIGVEQMGDLADSLADPKVLRLENLDTDLRPPQSALGTTWNKNLERNSSPKKIVILRLV